MASYKPLLSFHLSVFFLLLIFSEAVLPTTSCFSAIFSFGDSLADTGNSLFFGGSDSSVGRFPYGETYFHQPTGRFSDGRIVLDFIAQAVGVPLLPPYLAGSEGQDFRRGVNFAFGGATALSNDFFREKGIDVRSTDHSLRTQLDWFKQLLPSLCSSESECDDILSNSLFLVGEIGGNDYNYPLSQQKALDEIQTYVPLVISVISSTINVLIELGAKTLLVPGDFPIGCISTFLTTYQTQRSEEYDSKTGCIKWLNELSKYHNHLLQDELDKLRRIHPHATIIYADYYEVTMNIFRSPSHFGFNKEPLSACCGATGPYNLNATTHCGDKNMLLCDDPSEYICWDGLHLTEATYKIVADGIIEGPYAVPSIASVCSSSAEAKII